MERKISELGPTAQIHPQVHQVIINCPSTLEINFKGPRRPVMSLKDSDPCYPTARVPEIKPEAFMKVLAYKSHFEEISC